MDQTKTISREDMITGQLSRLGRCLELVAADPHFNDITVGLYLKGRTLTIWTFSGIEGCDERISAIRDRLVQLAEIEPISGTHDKAELISSELYDRALKFAFTEAVEKSKPIPSGPISTSDNKSKLIFSVTPEVNPDDGTWLYVVSAEGDYARPKMRIRAVVGGFMRYGGCERIDWDRFRFKNGERLDRFARLLLPYARNVSAVDDMIAAGDLAGQMTTQTLGFSQST